MLHRRHNERGITYHVTVYLGHCEVVLISIVSSRAPLSSVDLGFLSSVSVNIVTVTKVQ